MKHYTIPRLGTKLLLPLILLFALYVQFHGDYGPGGGFQAGVIFGAGFILYALIYGLDNARRLMPPWLLRIGVSLGVHLAASMSPPGERRTVTLTPALSSRRASASTSPGAGRENRPPVSL